MIKLILKILSGVLNRVRSEKDKAIYDFSEKFDGVRLHSLKVTSAEIREASEQVPDKLKSAINRAKINIEKFHSAQLFTEDAIETIKGVIGLGRRDAHLQRGRLFGRQAGDVDLCPHALAECGLHIQPAQAQRLGMDRRAPITASAADASAVRPAR